MQQIYLKNNKNQNKSKNTESTKNINKKDFIQSHYGAMRDSSIILKIFLAFRNFTTFSLNGEIFFQIFREKKNLLDQEIFGFCLIKI